MEKLLDALYTRLLLRDAFGKVLPGLLWFSSITVAAWGLRQFQRLVTNLDWPVAILLIGVGWIAGFAVQSVGKRFPVWRPETFPAGEFASDAELSDKLVAFHKKASENNEQQLERFITIKDATGNSYVAIILAAGTLLLDWGLESVTGSSSYPPVPRLTSLIAPIVFSFLAVDGLRRQHLKSSQRQARHIKAVLAWETDSVERQNE